MSEWSSICIRDAVSIQAPARRVKRSEYSDEGLYPVISQESGQINGWWNGEDEVTRVVDPVVIFGDHTRVVKYVDHDFVAGADGIKVLAPKPVMDPRFLYFVLLANPLRALGYSRHSRLLAEISFLLPPLAEQQRLVQKLDEIHDQVGSLTSNINQQIEEARSLREAVHRDRLFGGRVPSSISTAEGFPLDGSPVHPISEICEILDSKRKPITKLNRVPGGVPYFGASGVLDFVKDHLFDEKLVLVGEDGAKWGAGDRTAFIVQGKTWVNNHAHVLRPIPGKVTHEWITNFLVASDLNPFVTGVTVPKLNQNRLKSIAVPLPSISEQNRIVAELDEFDSELAELESKLAAQKAELAAFQSAALSEALAGGS